ncbi:hypothetical protein [Lutispora sp.]|uniref:hypothetical protein n=1 Tax=Lutispora sp. TaxID=2828727 RepID=UPI00356278E8
MKKMLAILFVMAMYTACLVGCDATHLSEKDNTNSIQSSSEPNVTTEDKTNIEQDSDY